MWWPVRGPWEVVKWIWAGIVLFFYALFAILNVLTWFDAEPTVYNNNPPRGGRGKEPPKEGEQPAAAKPS